MKKPILMAAALTMAICLLPVWHTVNLVKDRQNTVSPSDQISQNIAAGKDMLSDYGAVSVEMAQDSVDAARIAYEDTVAAENLKQTIESEIAFIQKGELTYREVFREVYICGDSLMCGLDVVGLINGRHLIAQVSAGLTHLEENLDRVIRAKPRVLILHYGINAVANNDAAVERFVTRYGKDIDKIREGSPNTRIIVSLLFPVDETVATDGRFKGVARFNEALVAMCEEKGIEYLDTTPVLKEHAEYYTADGIHQHKNFYSKYWFPYIMREMEIY